MPRLLFEKKGNAVWISHLDLMRVFQRAFKRAGLHLQHTQGFNPRASVSIALPMSVGLESCCELLDFDLEDDNVSVDQIASSLNSVLIDGVKVTGVYQNGRKLRELALLQCALTLTYDNGIPENCEDRLMALFAREQLIVPKKTKNGLQEQDIIPMIRKLTVERTSDNAVSIEMLICCQNPTLNPTQLVAAIAKYLPEMTPDFSRCIRLELYDGSENIFR